METKVGKGTTFHVYLPLILSDTVEKDDQKVEIPKGNERILIVDDEQSAVTAMHKMLERLGYDVTVRNNSLDALATFQNQPDQFDVIITDLQMGATNGVDVVRKAKEQDDNKIVIVITASYEATYAIDAFRSGADDYVLKPFSMTDLLERLHVQEERQSLQYNH